jgi:nicotinamide mononucleotide transporter
MWLEWLANAAATLSIVLAARNSVHTWWIGVVGCVLFAALFYQSRLYADATLQLFFIVTSVTGWRRWRADHDGAALLIGEANRRILVLLTGCGVVGAMTYGWLLHRWTDAYAPFLDSMVLACSIVAQLLLMRREVETWWFWIVVNLMAAPLFFSRELYLTSALYAAYMANALFALRHWRQLQHAQKTSRI